VINNFDTKQPQPNMDASSNATKISVFAKPAVAATSFAPKGDACCAGIQSPKVPLMNFSSLPQSKNLVVRA
jgi:hypothetical protein